MNNVPSGTIADCFCVVSRCGKEVDLLLDILVSNLKNEFSLRQKGMPCAISESEEPFFSKLADDSSWVWISSSVSLPLKKRNGSIILRHLCLQVSMTGSEIGFPENKDPLLHVNLWGDPIDLESDILMSFPLEWDEDMPFQVHNKMAVSWDAKSENGWLSKYWTFSLKLTRLNTPSDLKRNVIDPVIELLTGKNIDDVINSEKIPALFNYGSLIENPDLPG